mgnify:CR=1 FL=1
MKTKKKPQDSTLRNVQAANKKIAALSKRVGFLEESVQGLFEWIRELDIPSAKTPRGRK